MNETERALRERIKTLEKSLKVYKDLELTWHRDPPVLPKRRRK